MSGTSPDPSDFNLDETVRWRDHAEELDPEEYEFEDGTYPDDFIHGEVTIAWTEYDSSPGSVGLLRMRVEDGRTWLRFSTDDESYPGEAGEGPVDVGPAVGDEITARKLIQLMDRLKSQYVDTLGYIQSELASNEFAINQEERASRLAFLLRRETISDAATDWYDAVARHWVKTGELVYLEAGGALPEQSAP